MLTITRLPYRDVKYRQLLSIFQLNSIEFNDDEYKHLPSCYFLLSFGMVSFQKVECPQVMVILMPTNASRGIYPYVNDPYGTDLPTSKEKNIFLL